MKILDVHHSLLKNIYVNLIVSSLKFYVLINEVTFTNRDNPKLNPILYGLGPTLSW